MTVPVLSPTMRLLLAGLLTALLAAAVVVGVLSFRSLQRAEAEQESRETVQAVAERFTEAVNDYDVTTMDRYVEQISPMLSTKFRSEFEKSMQDIVTAVKETKMKSEGEVLTSGVGSIDRDSASVLVVADAEVDHVFNKVQRHFRWEVSLVKVDGRWLVDGFTPVA